MTSPDAAPPKAPPRCQRIAEFPIINAWLHDDFARKTARPFDPRWVERGAIRRTSLGFNPFSRTVFVPGAGPLYEYLRAREADPTLGLDTETIRDYNGEDQFVDQLLAAAHDYVHFIAYRWLPELTRDAPFVFGQAPITAESFDFYVYCHLLTEVCAIVGLDYWFLCNDVDYSDYLGVGSKRQAGLTVNYHRSWDQELRRFAPDFEVQHPGFFGYIADSFFADHFAGFDQRALRRSALIDAWISRDIGISVSQRVATREWMYFMAGSPAALAERASSSAHIEREQPWQHKLEAEMAGRLWNMMKRDDFCYPRVSFDLDALVQPLPEQDMRFMSLGFLDPETPMRYEGFACRQELLRHYYDGFDDIDLVHLIRALDTGDLATTQRQVERAGLRPLPHAWSVDERIIYLMI